MESGIIWTAEEGWLKCPTCNKKLQRIDRNTEAENMPIWCPRCSKEYKFSIHRDRSATTPESRNL